MEYIMPIRFILFPLFSVLLLSGCSNLVVATQKKLPPVYKDINETHQLKQDIPVSVFRLQNFTDTPMAGLRAANIVEGVLKAKGYRVISHASKKEYTLKKAANKAKEDGSTYFLYGGVSEWRYKTGIDGEPAVSLQLSMYKTKNKKLVWSATGSASDWGLSSVGSTAQSLIIDMMER